MRRSRGVSEDELRARFHPAEMTAKEIYPEIWSRDSPDDETIGYLIEYYRLLRGFLQQAVDANVGIVVVLCTTRRTSGTMPSAARSRSISAGLL